MRKHHTFNAGIGKWDSWGLGINYCHYARAITIEFIRWYAYIEWYPSRFKEDVGSDYDEPGKP